MTVMPDLYRKKPVAVEAVQFTAANAKDVASWCHGRIVGMTHGIELDIHTLEGMMTARMGDWIIKGVKGEFYPCREDIFLETYERVDGLK